MDDEPQQLSCEMLLLAVDLLKPRLKIWQGFLLPAGPRYSRSIIPKWRKAWGSDEAVEAIANEVHMVDFLISRSGYDDITAKQVNELAWVYAAMLEAEAKRVLRGGRFKVSVNYATLRRRPANAGSSEIAPEPDSRDDVTVTVYQIRE